MTTDELVVDVSQDWVLACDVQQRFMQGITRTTDSVDYSARCRQARALGGDCYDFMPLTEDRLALVVGDASGKGLAAALMIANVQSSLRTAALFTGNDVAALLKAVNHQAYTSSLADRYATVFYGVFDGATRTLRYVNAGHNPPVVLRHDGSVDWLEPGGAPVGMFPDSNYAESLLQYYGLNLRNEVEQFEKEFADHLGLPYAVAVSSGTGALHTALSALGVGPGQEIIVPAYMWVAVAAAVVNLGAIPVLADIDETFGINPNHLVHRISPRTRGVIAVHMSGAPINIVDIAKVARAHGLFLLEDCAQANGASVDGRKVGTFGDIGVFSFQMNKNMTAGEGGCVVTSDLQLYRRAVACHDLGYARDDDGRLMFDDLDLCLWGRGYRLDEIRGAMLRVQLRKLPRIMERMRNSKYRIRKALEKLPGVQLRRIVDPIGDTGAFLITTYGNAAIAEKVNHALRAEGITTYPQGVSNIRMTEWGLHLYYNIVSLVGKRSVDKLGFPGTWLKIPNQGRDTRRVHVQLQTVSSSEA